MPANLEFELATSETEGDFRRLLRENPLAGNINLALTREPNAFHAASVSGDIYELMLAYRKTPRQLVGGGARFELEAYINGEIECIGYLGELRVHGGFQQRRTLLLEAYRAMRLCHEAGNAPCYLTTIISDNTSTRRLLEAGLADMPTYQPMEEMVTLAIPTRQAVRTRCQSVQANQNQTFRIEDIAEHLQRTGRTYQFHSVWSAETLRSEQRCRGLSAEDFVVVGDESGIRGSLCLWDQRAFKQSVVSGYSGQLARKRLFLNIVAPLLGQARLPTPGQKLESAFLSHLSVDPDDEATLLSLIRRAGLLAAGRGIDYLMLGVAVRNKLAKIVQQRFSCHKYASMIYLVYWEDGREFACKIDGRIAHPEIAIL